jgi:hypothetical protein
MRIFEVVYNMVQEGPVTGRLKAADLESARRIAERKTDCPPSLDTETESQWLCIHLSAKPSSTRLELLSVKEVQA